MSFLIKHIILVFLGLCAVLIAQAQLPLNDFNAAIMILMTVSISSVILAFVGVSLSRHHDFAWIAATVAIYAAALIAVVLRVDQLSIAILWPSAGAIFFMAGTTWLAVRAARHVHEVDELGALLLCDDQLKSAMTPDDFQLCGEKLLAQCHRHHRPLAVIAVQWQICGRPEDEIETSVAGRLAAHLRRHELIAGINDALRTSDLMLSGDRTDRCFLVCPDTDLASAMEFCARLEAILAKKTQAKIAFGVAHFGEAGYDLSELIAAAIDRVAGAQSHPVLQPAPETPAILPGVVRSPARDWARQITASSLTKIAG